jgi:hypothetical protein
MKAQTQAERDAEADALRAFQAQCANQALKRMQEELNRPPRGLWSADGTFDPHAPNGGYKQEVNLHPPANSSTTFNY